MRQAGFTLLELLVSLAVFAILSALAYGGLLTVTKSYDYNRSAWQQLAEWQRGFFVMERDVMQVMPRPVRNAFGAVEGAVQRKIGEPFLVQFTRGGFSNPAELARGEVGRVAYLVEEEQLVRLVWYFPDRVYPEPQSRQVLIRQVEDAKVRFMNANGDWQEFWENAEILPRAWELTLTVRHVGALQRLWVLE